MLATTLAVLLAVAAEPQSPAESLHTPYPAGVTVSLTVADLGVLGVDPLHLKGNLELVVHNGSSQTISVPETYDGKSITLIGRGRGQYHESRFIATGNSKPQSVALAPGQRRTLLKLPYSDLFDAQQLRGDKPRYVWSWLARPAPPISPLHSGAESATDFVDEAVLWAKVNSGGDVVCSEPLILTIHNRK